MTGKELKEKLYNAKVTQADLAKKLQMSTQAMSQTLNAADIKTGFLEKVCEAIGVNMSFFYPIDEQKAVVNGNNSVAAIQSTVTQGDCAVLAERVKSLEALLAEKERLISVLMEVRK
jgi:transcriptional regulator with XRE-family HTH domain